MPRLLDFTSWIYIIKKKENKGRWFHYMVQYDKNVQFSKLERLLEIM